MTTQRVKRNWKLLMNGKEHKLVKGKDFNSFLSIRTSIYNKSKDSGVKVSTRIEGNTLFVRFHP